CISFDNGLAHTLYAGSDIFLMPSLFEPCGLSQLVAMTYGTIPIVRETGGLRDTVVPYNEFTGEGNGFSFANINAHEFLFVTKYACDLYRHNKPVWNKLIEEGMKADYSWKKSAEEYAGLYSFITGISIAEEEEPEKKPLTEEILDIPKKKKAEPKKTEAKKPAAKKAAPKAKTEAEKKPEAKKAPAKTAKSSSTAKKAAPAAEKKPVAKSSKKSSGETENKKA
ncbi:MAG: glycosyltransferase, partial [Clostridiales bacterium]|nr:glycosyltransferase [Clostridiales bacterium]